MPRPRQINKAIIRLSSHPSRKSLCFNSKLSVVVVVIGLMETRLYNLIWNFSLEASFVVFTSSSPSEHTIIGSLSKLTRRQSTGKFLFKFRVMGIKGRLNSLGLESFWMEICRMALRRVWVIRKRWPRSLTSI